MASSTAVIMSDTVKKDVVYSTKCVDEGYKSLDASTQLLVEYSVMTLEQKLMTPKDIHDAIHCADGVLDFVNGVCKIGSAVFPPGAPVFLFVAGVGSTVQWLMGKYPDHREKEVVTKFKELEKAVHQLEDLMVAQFADMQAFMSEHNFNVNITTEASTLACVMRDCMKYQDKKDVENFCLVYEQNTPLDMAYFMVNLLTKNPSTNPLIMAMSAEKGKTKETFHKWKLIIMGIFGQLHFIESFASGLMSKTTHDKQRIAEEQEKIRELFEKLEDEYKNDDGYWTEFTNGFEQYLADHTDLSNVQKADDIKKQLDTYLTRDLFYICVLNESTHVNLHYSGYCTNEADQFIMAINKGKCCAFVYRSRNAGEIFETAYEELGEQVRNCPSKIHWKNYTDTIGDMAKDDLEPLIPGYGFYCIVQTGDSINPAFAYSDAPKDLKLSAYQGPGMSTDAVVGKELQASYRIIVSFD